MRAAALGFVGVLLLILEALLIGLFDLEMWMPHLALGLVVFMAVRPSLFEACVAVICVAWGADALGCAPTGVRAMSLTLVFFAVRLSAARLDVNSNLVLALVSIVAAAAMITLEVLIVTVLAAHGTLFPALLYGGLPGSLTAPIGLALSFPVMTRLESLFADRKDALR